LGSKALTKRPIGEIHTPRPGRAAIYNDPSLSLHVILQFEPKPGKADEFREEVLRVNGPSRAEPGCIAIDVFESVREPVRFAIHSVWVDEAAFELHARLPHTVRFLDAARDLLTHPVEGLRVRQIGGGPGAGGVVRQTEA
jgi:quinol monooxygenase YgiN